jgi:hypothetical protein
MQHPRRRWADTSWLLQDPPNTVEHTAVEAECWVAGRGVEVRVMSAYVRQSRNGEYETDLRQPDLRHRYSGWRCGAASPDISFCKT